MKTNKFLSLLLFIGIMVFILACEKEDQSSKTTKPSGQPMFKTKQSKENGTNIANLAVMLKGGALIAEEDSAGAKENLEGIGHFKEGHWAESETHFRKALAVNANLAEAHYNLALALAKLGYRGDATEHFKKALELAPDNPKIKDSKILKDHVGA
jgi:Flp pilus assembly protein TadD